MDIHDSVAVVTGANRGLGRHFAEQLLERGAARVYAASRDPQRVDIAGAVPLQLDARGGKHLGGGVQGRRALHGGAGYPLTDPCCDPPRCETRALWTR
jgi:NAD(P)-dependent dehydrogenase (short-subunit alcohol dehydrogenase family)